MANGLGQVFGPLLAGGLYEIFQGKVEPVPDNVEKDAFSKTCDIFSGICFVYFLLYFFICNGPKAFADSIKNTCRALKNKEQMTKDGRTRLVDDMTADEDDEIESERTKLNKINLSEEQSKGSNYGYK